MGKIEYHLTESQEKQGKFHGKKGIYAPPQGKAASKLFLQKFRADQVVNQKKRKKKEP